MDTNTPTETNKMKITTEKGTEITINGMTATIPGAGEWKVNRVYEQGGKEIMNLTQGYKQVLQPVPVGTMAKHAALNTAANIPGTIPHKSIIEHDNFRAMMEHEDETMIAYDDHC